MNCTAFVVDFERNICYSVQIKSEELIPESNATFFHQICITGKGTVLSWQHVPLFAVDLNHFNFALTHLVACSSKNSLIFAFPQFRQIASHADCGRWKGPWAPH